MTIDELIKKLERIKLEHGNLDVVIPGPEGCFDEIGRIHPQRPYKDGLWPEDKSRPPVFIKLLRE